MPAKRNSKIIFNVSSFIFFQMFKKDLSLLFSTKKYFLGSLSLAAGLFLFFRFLLPPGALEKAYLPVSLFAAYNIAALFLVFSLRNQETQWGAMQLPMILGIDMAWVYLSAVAALFVGLFVLYFFSFLTWILLYVPAIDWPNSFAIVESLFIGIAMSLAIGAIGPLLASMAGASSLDHLLLLILYFPLALPVISVLSGAMRAVLGKAFQFSDLGLAFGYGLLYLAVGMILYAFLSEE